MTRELTTSPLDRQNILNNQYAMTEIEKATQIQGIPFEGRTVVLKDQIADFFEITTRTIDNYLERFGEELTQNGYEVLKGRRLKELKLAIHELDVHETDFVNILKTPQLGIFDFRRIWPSSCSITASAPQNIGLRQRQCMAAKRVRKAPTRVTRTPR
jgi:hypothetical protein